MQKIVKALAFAKKVLSTFLPPLLLLYSILIFISLLFEPLIPIRLISLPFYVIVPGYAFVALFLPRLRILEKAIVSIGFSLALFVGIKSFMLTFDILYLFLESAILAALSIMFLASDIILEIFRGE